MLKYKLFFGSDDELQVNFIELPRFQYVASNAIDGELGVGFREGVNERLRFPYAPWYDSKAPRCPFRKIVPS